MTLAYRLSKGVLNTIAPPIILASTWAESYIPKPGRPLISMSQGAPGILPPKLLSDALTDVVNSGQTGGWGYGPWNGEKCLREALVKEMKHVYGRGGDPVEVNESDVAITAGCNMALFAVIMTIAGHGDEVILPVPWYFNNQMDLTLLGINPVSLYVTENEGFLPSLERCRSLITPRTKGIVLVTPNNPTGVTYPPSLIASFVQLTQSHNVALILDETYRDFITTPGPPHTLFSSPTWRDSLIHLFSFSKSYCIPGHRIGNIVASPTLLLQARTVLDTIAVCPPRPIQLALSSTLEALRPSVHSEAMVIEAKHQLFKKLLPKAWTVGRYGGYFAFVRHPYSDLDAMDVSKRLAIEAGLVTLPAGFFSPNHEAGLAAGWNASRWMRFSVGNVTDEQIVDACQRLDEWKP